VFKLLGLLLFAYAVSVARKGRMTIRDGERSRVIHRDEAPVLVWFHCGIYAALALILTTLP
jgi:hypothetical protein